MATDTITIPNVQLTLDQLISAVRQLKPEARSKVARESFAARGATQMIQALVREGGLVPAIKRHGKNVFVDLAS